MNGETVEVAVTAHNASTPIRTLRQRRREETRSEIVRTAVALFEEQGYDRTSVEQIAARAGISLRTFYRYCAAKDETLTYELAVGHRQLAANIAAEAGRPLFEAVRAGFLATVRDSGSDTEELRRMFRVILATPAIRATWLSAGRDAQDELTAVLAEHWPRRSASRGRAIAATIVAVLTAALEEWGAGSSSSLADLIDEYLDELTPTLAV